MSQYLGHQQQLVVLRDSLHKLLQKGSLDSFPTDSPLLTLDTFLVESAALVKERLTRIDKELAEVKQANIMEMVSKLQSRYGEAGSKMMKPIMGKIGASQDCGGLILIIPTQSNSPLSTPRLNFSNGP